MLSADIICSFPTETEEELTETVEYLKSIGFLHIHAFSYSKRPGTPAEKLSGQIPEDIKRQRMHRFLQECAKMELSAHESKIGTCGTILVERCTKNVVLGHTEDFCEAVCLTTTPYKEGDLVSVRVTGFNGERLVCTPLV